MTSPYKKYLAPYLQSSKPVSLDRDGARTLIGQLIELNDDGCVIQSREGASIGTVQQTFVAYSHIRGVSTVEHDYENL